MTTFAGLTIPNLRGRTAVVTGANSGLGLQTATALAGAGARVLMACRSPERAAAAEQSIRAEHPDAALEVVALDLADLASVRGAATRILDLAPSLDLLMNNAGVMASPRRETADGFELQLGTNHLGHVALTAALLPALLAAPAARVVATSSIAHRHAVIDLNDLQRTRHYFRWSAYGQSKLANLLFAMELQRRFDAAGVSALSVAAHPGLSATNLQAGGPLIGLPGPLRSVLNPVLTLGGQLVGQSDSQGALPQLYAATAPDVQGGEFFGPDGPAELRGRPIRVRARRAAYDGELAAALWDRSVELTGADFSALSG